MVLSQHQFLFYQKIHHPCLTLVPNYFDYEPPGSKEAKSEVQGLVDFFAVIVQNAIAIFILQTDLPWVQRSGMRDCECSRICITVNITKIRVDTTYTTIKKNTPISVTNS